MKTIYYLLFVIAIFTACNNKPAVEATVEETVVIDSTATRYLVDTAASILNWTGEALSYAHSGTIRLSDGVLSVKEGLLTAGTFTIDIKSIKNTDIPDPARNAMLVGHLNDTDFFNSKLFPTGKFEVTGVTQLTNDSAGNTHQVSGNLTLKGITKNISFPVKASINAEALTVTGNVLINRLDWDIKYESTTAFPNLKAKLKDNAIKDELKISISLSAKKG